jgi:hypothetical protein
MGNFFNNGPKILKLIVRVRIYPSLRNINLENLLICIMSNEDLDFNAVFSVFFWTNFPNKTGKNYASYI